MIGQWRKHTEITEIYTFHEDSNCLEAQIYGRGKDWQWSAFVWSDPETKKMLGWEEGEAVSAESAKEDIQRWFQEQIERLRK